MTTLLIDNYDSFTYNIYQYLSELGAEIVVHRNNKVTVKKCEDLNPDRVVISPGPGRPSGAGVSTEIVRRFAGVVPVLGICLGHQCICEAFEGEIVQAGEIKHGKTSTINHDGKGLFAGVPNQFTAVRYHSLTADPQSLPETLQVSARSESGIIMGVRHKHFTVEGVQFHPESIATEHGKALLQNFLELSGGEWGQ
ncbi:MAG: anthranilate/aminodeoxychorismate synthase component II [Dehalococcoidia bacterium]|nr:anthranilate/aminodeoxychorismate synthase component II [Dehalococcoidia bacterium]HCV00342.1 anthranilate/aminodeoxychorismate synthase component II [Dehalococcoidia bacterium]|tara:strand:- start:852 stop:1439 length:588 start_codon:yes stop_codon:yes gene_type:complete